LTSARARVAELRQQYGHGKAKRVSRPMAIALLMAARAAGFAWDPSFWGGKHRSRNGSLGVGGRLQRLAMAPRRKGRLRVPAIEPSAAETALPRRERERDHDSAEINKALGFSGHGQDRCAHGRAIAIPGRGCNLISQFARFSYASIA
jgi:hypothetical protein